ncbi:MAG: nitroreductase family protein [Deltaproteobacteria bacterium]|nr:nitroreductase family protein [Deltaproteobacteria bacterium]
MQKPAPTDHPIHPLLTERWSPRAFEARPLPREDLDALLEAARWAASSMNEQPWRFVVAGREDEAAFERIAACLSAGNQPWARNAGALVAVVVAETFRRNGKKNAHAWYDAGAAVAQLTLEATHRGLAVHQMGGFDGEALREALGIPEGHAPVVVLAIGIPGDVDRLSPELAERERAPRKRLPLEALVFERVWPR